MLSFVKLTAIFFYHGIYFLRGRNGDKMKLRMGTELLREILRASRLRNTGREGGRKGEEGGRGGREGGRERREGEEGGKGGREGGRGGREREGRRGREGEEGGEGGRRGGR